MNKDKHILKLLEKSSLRALDEHEVAAILEHTVECQTCLNAYRAAQVASALLEARVTETMEPSPFFEMRVLAQVRELQKNEGWGLLKLWRAAGALASSMAVTVLVLGVLTVALPGEQAASTQEGTRVSAEAVILNQTEFYEELASDGQVLGTLYATEEDATK
jgi:anti-sigma-K factor RskA